MNKNSKNKPGNGLPSIEDTHPIEAAILDVKENGMNPDNHFRHHTQEQVAKAFVTTTVLMEHINNALELPQNATVEQFATRIRDLFYANRNLNHPPS